jgi:hypothetical protein
LDGHQLWLVLGVLLLEECCLLLIALSCSIQGHQGNATNGNIAHAFIKTAPYSGDLAFEEFL